MDGVELPKPSPMESPVDPLADEVDDHAHGHSLHRRWKARQRAETSHDRLLVDRAIGQQREDGDGESDQEAGDVVTYERVAIR